MPHISHCLLVILFLRGIFWDGYLYKHLQRSFRRSAANDKLQNEGSEHLDGTEFVERKQWVFALATGWQSVVRFQTVELKQGFTSTLNRCHRSIGGKAVI